MYRLLVWGEWACFPRPEFAVDMVSYPTMTPLAARGIIESIHWRPAIRWQIPRFRILRAGEPMEHPVALKQSAESQGKARIVALRNVAYLIEADFTLTDRAGDRDSVIAHQRMFEQRVRKDRPFRRPYFGVRDCPASFRLLLKHEEIEGLSEELCGRHDWGWLPSDQEEDRSCPRLFFRALSQDGVIDIPPPGDNRLFG